MKRKIQYFHVSFRQFHFRGTMYAMKIKELLRNLFALHKKKFEEYNFRTRPYVGPPMISNLRQLCINTGSQAKAI